METDVLIVGQMEFTGWSAPSEMGLGGKQALATHKLIGGSRVIDSLGPDDADITWSGQFYGDDALANVTVLDQMRMGGQPQPCFAMGQAFTVVVEDFTYKAVHFPQYFTYSITLQIVTNNGAGSIFGAAVSVGSLVLTDLSAAVSLVAGF